MKFPGWWVIGEGEDVRMVATRFDDTELDPATKWMEAWQNQEEGALVKGFVMHEPALAFAAHCLAAREGRALLGDEERRAMRVASALTGVDLKFRTLAELLGLAPQDSPAH
jgi:hypothetical protein